MRRPIKERTSITLTETSVVLTQRNFLLVIKQKLKTNQRLEHFFENEIQPRNRSELKQKYISFLRYFITGHPSGQLLN